MVLLRFSNDFRVRALSALKPYIYIYIYIYIYGGVCFVAVHEKGPARAIPTAMSGAGAVQTHPLRLQVEAGVGTSSLPVPRHPQLKSSCVRSRRLTFINGAFGQQPFEYYFVL